MNLEECLEKYKNLTLELIDKTKHGEDLKSFINERENIIKELGNIDFSKEEFKKKLDALNIMELDKELQKLVVEEKIKTKEQIDNLKKARIIRKNYSNSYGNLNFFSGKS